MASKVWLLVKWLEPIDTSSTYGIVNVDTFAYHDTELQPGNVILVRDKHGVPNPAKLLRMSENKRYVKEYKETLEREDEKVRDMLRLCMRTLTDMEPEKSFHGNQSRRQIHPRAQSEIFNTVNTPNQRYHSRNLEAAPYPSHQSGNQVSLPCVEMASNSDSSDMESETHNHVERSRNQSFNRSVSNYPSKFMRNESHAHFGKSLNTVQRHAMLCSTPLPELNVPQRVTSFCDMSTQTEPELLRPPIEKVEEMEAVLKKLYRRFQYLVDHVNGNPNGSLSASDTEQNGDASHLDLNNESSSESNNTQSEDQESMVGGEVPDVAAEHVLESDPSNRTLVAANVKLEDNRTNPNMLRVRRVSAQTTNNIESAAMSHESDMVPIGNGNAKVPRRLLNDIDWNSHTTATRQLLQAVFPRSVLATHSLTGRQSPAFMNRPPKKVLDPKLVEDVVKIVSTRCGVPNNLIRNTITIKCTDEAKLYRNRQVYKMQRQNVERDENRPTSTPSSDESSSSYNI